MIIAVDYGDSRCGLAQSTERMIASPLPSVKTEKIIQHLLRLQPQIVIVGVSEGKSAEKSKKFAKEVENVLGCTVKLVDETLTTIEAKKITKDKDDNSVAAAIILERYLENV